MKNSSVNTYYEEERMPHTHGDCEQTRDFIHVDDAVEAATLALNCKNCSSEIINVQSRNSITINKLAELSLKLHDRKDLEPVFRAAGKGDIGNRCADISKASKILGYKPKKTLEKRLQKLCLCLKNILKNTHSGELH